MTYGMSAGATGVVVRQKKSRKRGAGADDDRQAATSVAICGGLRVMPATSATQVREETAQSAEAAETVALSRTDWGVPAAREEILSMSGMSAGASEDAVMQEGSRRLQGREPRYSHDVDSGTEGRRPLPQSEGHWATPHGMA